MRLSETKTTSTKTFEHVASVAFRQWRAESHCRFVHGYALTFRFEFGCSALDHRGWVVDFGGLKPLKRWLEATFDHKLMVAQDDPLCRQLVELGETGAANVVLVERCGAEAFALLAYRRAEEIVAPTGRWVESVEVWEHTGNSARVSHVYSRQ